MSFGRDIVVTIGGTEYQADTLANVQIEMGGRTAWEQNVAGIASITINQEDPGVLINDTFTVDIESPEGVAATGGTVTEYVQNGVRYIVHTFTSDGDFVVTSPGEVDYLIVAGGGAGGDCTFSSAAGGGGGAGGLLVGTTTASSQTYSVVVGAGGISPAAGGKGGDGGDSSVFGSTAVGGGGGIGNDGTLDASGGSGGGQRGRLTTVVGFGIAGQGNDGGTASGTDSLQRGGGGGGGASSAGADGSGFTGGSGGIGSSSAISGSSVVYATGGDGGSSGSSANRPGVDGLGEGGSGSGTLSTDGGQPGGDGIVIIRYADPRQRLFTGVVDATEASITDIGPLWNITASGPLTQTGRRQLTSIIAADTEGDQIALLAQDALGKSWEATGGTWAAQGLTWDGFAVDTSAIDQPGLYGLAAIDTLPASVIDELAKAAFSGSGWLYETRYGLLGYADSTHRENLPDDEYITIPGSVTGRNAFITATQEADIANVVEIVYDGGSVEGKAVDSIQVYGRWDRSYDTTLASQSDAEAFATRRLELEGAPRMNLAGSVSIDLRQCSDTLLDQLILIERNYGVIVENVPAYLDPEGVYRGFVEGYRWSLGPDEPTLDLFLSEYSLSNFGLRWAAAGPTQWGQVGASLTWQNATEALA